jgi:hypothetical protein
MQPINEDADQLLRLRLRGLCIWCNKCPLGLGANTWLSLLEHRVVGRRLPGQQDDLHLSDASRSAPGPSGELPKVRNDARGADTEGGGPGKVSEEDAELQDMTRRFWSGGLYPLPLSTRFVTAFQ